MNYDRVMMLIQRAQLEEYCTMCDGDGKFEDQKPCTYCRGTGYRPTELGFTLLKFLRAHGVETKDQ